MTHNHISVKTQWSRVEHKRNNAIRNDIDWEIVYTGQLQTKKLKYWFSKLHFMNLQEQLSKIKQKPQSGKKQQQQLKQNEIQLKIGATVDIPRVQYPTIYVSGQTHKQISKQMLKNINAAKIVSEQDKSLIYPILPAKIALEYCSLFNSQYTDEEIMKMNKVTLSFEQVVDQLDEIFVTPQNTQILKYSHLHAYLKQVLVNSILNDQQKLYIIINGRKETFTVQVPVSQQKYGIFSPSTQMRLQTLNIKDSFLQNIKTLLKQYKFNNGYSTAIEKVLIDAVHLIAKNKNYLENSLITQLFNQLRTKAELSEYITSIHLRRHVQSTLLYSLPGMGKSQFFSDLNELLPGFVHFYSENDVENQNLFEKLSNTAIVFIDEVDQYSTYQLQIIQQVLFQRYNNVHNGKYFIAAATNRKDYVMNINILKFDTIEEVTIGYNQIKHVVDKLLSDNLQINHNDSKVKEDYELAVKKLIKYLEQYSMADIFFILNNILDQYKLRFTKDNESLVLRTIDDVNILFSYIRQSLLQYQPSNLKNYSVTQKTDANQDLQFEISGIKEKIDIIQQLLQSNDFSNPILFYGYPGSGKGYSLKILSNHLNLSIMSVSSSEIQSPYVGQTEKNLEHIFLTALHYQILFLDEIDILFDHMSQQTSYGQRLLSVISNQLDRQQFLLIGATNRPWAIHHRLLSRFNIKFFYDFLPLKETINTLLKNKISKYFTKDLITRLQKLTSESQNNVVFDPFNQNESCYSQFLERRTSAELSQLIYQLKLMMVQKQQLQITQNDFDRSITALGKSQITDKEIQQFQEFNMQYIPVK